MVSYGNVNGKDIIVKWVGSVPSCGASGNGTKIQKSLLSQCERAFNSMVIETWYCTNFDRNQFLVE